MCLTAYPAKHVPSLLCKDVEVVNACRFPAFSSITREQIGLSFRVSQPAG